MVLVVSGDEMGLLKTFDLSCSITTSNSSLGVAGSTKQTVKRPPTTSHLPEDLTQSRGNGVTCLNWLNEEKTTIAVGRKGPSVEVWNTTSPTGPNPNSIKYTKRIDLFTTTTTGVPSPTSTEMYEDILSTNQLTSTTLTATTCYGNVYKIDLDTNTYEKLTTDKPLVPKPPTSTRSKSFSGRTPVTSTFYLTPTKLLLGGRDREVQIFDLESMKSTWKGKNLPPDPQTLLQCPLWQTCLGGWGEKGVCVGTAYKELRLYDTRQRRPTSVVGGNSGEVIESMVTACTWASENRVVVGTSEGYMHDVDVRMLKVRRRLVGPNGCVKDVKAKGDWVGGIGLDRVWNCWDGRGRRRGEVYVRQRGVGFLWGDGEIEVEEEEEEGEEEGVWEGEGKKSASNLDVNAEDEVGEIVFSSDEEEGDSDNDDLGINNQSDSDNDEGFGSDEEFFNPGMQTKTKKGGDKKKKGGGGGGGGGGNRKKQRR